MQAKLFYESFTGHNLMKSREGFSGTLVVPNDTYHL